MLSPETSLKRGAPVWPLFAKELREIVGGRALWTLLLLACALVGYSFFGKLYLQHTLPESVSGKIGLWSKADSYMHFDDFTVAAAE